MGYFLHCGKIKQGMSTFGITVGQNLKDNVVVDFTLYLLFGFFRVGVKYIEEE